MLHNLVRTHGVEIRDWVWLLEWHRNGFPHWHLFVEVSKSGRSGQLYTLLQNSSGQSNRRWGGTSYWPYGYVHEDYIRSQNHWDQMTGYFSQKGYFDKKKSHQAILPDWALMEKRRIRRTGSKRIKSTIPDPIRNKAQRDRKNQKNQEFIDKMETAIDLDIYDEMVMNPDPVIRTYQVILDECGSETSATIIYKENGVVQRVMGFPIRISYQQMKKDYPGEYKPRTGIVLYLSSRQMELFIHKYRCLA